MQNWISKYLGGQIKTKGGITQPLSIGINFKLPRGPNKNQGGKWPRPLNETLELVALLKELGFMQGEEDLGYPPKTSYPQKFSQPNSNAEQQQQ